MAGDRTARRVSILCADCGDVQALDVILGASTDGTEGRFRSGETTLAELEQTCRSNTSSCRMRALEIGGAIGWSPTYAFGSTNGATTVLFQDGDLLTLRAIGPDRQTVSRISQPWLFEIGARIVTPWELHDTFARGALSFRGHPC
ncbi:MAG: hypothetical protein AAGE03_08330 [Pseudomonadota bacterium]